MLLRIVLFALLLNLPAGAGSALAAPVPADTDKAGARVYQCPMHPWIKSAEPGKCTICGMNLVMAGPASAASATEGHVALLPSMITAIGIEASTIARQPIARTLRVYGRIDDDDTRHRILSARVPGRIEHLNITFTGQQVEAGAPLATLYSPEIFSAQRIYVERLRAGEGAFPAAERTAARERLLELGLTDGDIATLEKSLQPSATVIVRAPVTGTVVTKSVYEGQYVQVSDRLFEIADFSSMWFVFDVYEQDVPWLRVGQTVEITTRAVPGEVLLGPVAFIDPNFNETTRTTKARVVLSNPHPATMSGEAHALPHRVPAEGRVLVASPSLLAAPRSAVLDAGTGPVAYVDHGGGHYEQRRLHLGRRGDSLVEVIHGLVEGEKVVTTGALLVDAQAQLAREAGLHAHGGAGPRPANDMTQVRPASLSPTLNPQPSTPVPALASLATAAINASGALAADDYAAYQKIFPTLGAAAKDFPALPSLELGADLLAARRSFESWSTAVADLVKPHRESLGLKVFQCPMTPVLGKGRWIQRGQPLKNPFFGSSMANCGTEVP